MLPNKHNEQSGSLEFPSPPSMEIEWILFGENAVGFIALFSIEDAERGTKDSY